MPTQHLKPFAWYGGKEQLAALLCSLLPVHEVYCEVFGGSGARLFAKPKSRLEIFNDLDSGVVTFFRVLRTNKRGIATYARPLRRLTHAEHAEIARRSQEDVRARRVRAARTIVQPPLFEMEKTR